MKTFFEKQKKQYLINQGECDVNAFKVLDASGDGELQKAELVAALMPNTTRNTEFLKALGFDVEQGARMVDFPG